MDFCEPVGAYSITPLSGLFGHGILDSWLPKTLSNVVEESVGWRWVNHLAPRIPHPLGGGTGRKEEDEGLSKHGATVGALVPHIKRFFSGQITKYLLVYLWYFSNSDKCFSVEWRCRVSITQLETASTLLRCLRGISIIFQLKWEWIYHGVVHKNCIYFPKKMPHRTEILRCSVYGHL